MTGPPGDNRRFSEEEVALIIKRAAELQQTEEVAKEPGNAMTLHEVEQIAKEAGIDPLLIRRAAQTLEHSSQETNRPSPWLGAPTRIVFERVVDGEITADDYESIVNELRRTFSDNGITSVLGRTLAWTMGAGGGRRSSRGRQVDASVISRGGVTTIRVEEELRNTAGALFGGLMGGGAGGTTGITIGGVMALTESFPLAASLWVIVAGGFYALARTIFGRIASNRERELRELVARLEDEVRDAVSQAATRRLGAPVTGTPAPGDARSLLNQPDSLDLPG